MSHHWDSGVMVRKPSWHRLENAVLLESPKTWEEGRTAAGLTWEVETEPVYRCYDNPNGGPVTVEKISDWQVLTRNDNMKTLSIQPKSYEVIHNARFGEVIDTALGLEGDERPNFEAIFSLYGGKQIIALCYFDEPLRMPWDPSKTYTYCAFNARHDGNGGLRAIFTDVRVQCANTWNQAENIDGKAAGFTIRHTSNWQERLEDFRDQMRKARGDSQQWVDFAEQLARWDATTRRRETFLKRMFPVSDDMQPRQTENQLVNREKIRTILASETCAGIEKTGYGLLMATTEWSDHVRTWQSTNSYVSRQLLTRQEPKARAGQVLAGMIAR
jgi:phage/plasmid-like protein (TIGR03299 family)